MYHDARSSECQMRFEIFRLVRKEVLKSASLIFKIRALKILKDVTEEIKFERPLTLNSVRYLFVYVSISSFLGDLTQHRLVVIY
jgi:hypothetical protein